MRKFALKNMKREKPEAKLINGMSTWRLEADGKVFRFNSNFFAMFLEKLLEQAGYEVQMDWDEWQREEK